MSTLTAEESAVMEARLQEIQTRDCETFEQLQRHAQATYRAVEGWHLGAEGMNRGLASHDPTWHERWRPFASPASRCRVPS